MRDPFEGRYVAFYEPVIGIAFVAAITFGLVAVGAAIAAFIAFVF